VADPVGKEFVVGAEAGVSDDFAGGGVNRLALDPGLRRLKRCCLRLVDDVEYALHLVCRLAENEGAAQVRGVALDRAAAINEQDGAFTNDLRHGGTVRQGGVFRHLHAGAALETELRVRSGDEGGKIILRHAGLQRLPGCFIRHVRYARGEPHQVELMRGLDLAAAGGDGLALTTFICGAALAMPSAKTNLVVSSAPSEPVAMPRSRRPCATRWCGLSSSCQVRTSGLAPKGPRLICSRARSSSNAGVTKKGSPLAGSTMPKRRSPPPHRMPLK